MISKTHEQRKALKRVYRRLQAGDNPAPCYRDFLNSVSDTVKMDNAIVVPFLHMWLAIEVDGYTHS
tara:strand:- start:77 stop:274 length:198 start_codon:yes stop_codon:yes gene_type:complete